MAALTTFVAPSDLKLALNPTTYLAIFDDGNTGVVQDTDPGVLLVLERSFAEVLSYLPRIYDSLPTGIPTLLKSCQLDYAVALSYERHPEYVRSFGEEKRAERWGRAEKRMERIADSFQEITDNAPAARPGNVGGITYDAGPRMLTDSSDGTNNSGDF